MRKKTGGHASLLLARYEHSNHDLPRALRRQLAVFVLCPKVGISALEELFARPLGQTPRSHYSWMWYTAMCHSGLERYWDEFIHRYNTEVSFRECLRWLRLQATEHEWLTLSRRLGVKRLQPSDYDAKPRTNKYWTRGGIWDRRNGLTRVIVLGESLERDYSYNTTTAALGPARARTLERELHNLIPYDDLLYPDAVAQAMAYVRRRIPEILGHRRQASLKTVSWFFQERLPVGDGYVDFRSRYSCAFKVRKRGRRVVGHWLPPKDLK